MKKKILSMLLLAVSLVAMSQNKFYIWKTDGSFVEYNTSEVDSITTSLPMPIVTTNSISNLGAMSATCGGEVNSVLEITERGVCYDVNPNPTIMSNTVYGGVGKGSFVVNITGLEHSKTYYARAYATCLAGTIYGNQRQFVTLAITLPTVSTSAVSEIKATSVICGGNIVSEYAVSERGLCYGTNANPTTADSKVRSGSGTGDFSTSIIGLQANTTYYVRAYAINPAGTSYGPQRSFTTSSGIATFGTLSSSNITSNGVTITGIINADGGANITERGVCYGASANPTISNSKVKCGSGVGSYTCNITGLQSNITYYVRPYAINAAGTYYGNQISFTTDEEQVVISDNGKLPGVFSVSATKQVKFSQGNLQYQASTDTWRFAEHQYDMVGMGYGLTDEDEYCYLGGTIPNSDNREISSTYTGWIDLFGWGTGNNPTNSSTNISNYSTFVDWGVNKISNGGNVANAWFTLSYAEWDYLINTRTNASSKRGVAEVNGITGLVLLPDNWTLPSGAHFTSGTASHYGFEYYKTVNAYTASEWTLMEEAGAVFLPAAGYRYGTSVGIVGYSGNYWSCTEYGTDYASSLSIDSNGVSTNGYGYRGDARSVRLCSEFR